MPNLFSLYNTSKNFIFSEPSSRAYLWIFGAKFVGPFVSVVSNCISSSWLDWTSQWVLCFDLAKGGRQKGTIKFLLDSPSLRFTLSYRVPKKSIKIKFNFLSWSLGEQSSFYQISLLRPTSSRLISFMSRSSVILSRENFARFDKFYWNFKSMESHLYIIFFLP